MKIRKPFFLNRTVATFVLLLQVSFSFGQSEYYGDWEILAGSLTNGKLVFAQDETKTVKFEVTAKRFLNPTGGGFLAFKGLTFALGRVQQGHSGWEAELISNFFGITQSDFTDANAGLVTKEFALTITAAGTSTADDLVRNNDEILLIIPGSDGQPWAPDKVYSVTVTTPTTSPPPPPPPPSGPTGNAICCNQCIISGQAAAPLTQTPGIGLPVSPSLSYTWQSSTGTSGSRSDGPEFTNIAGGTNVNYSPGILTRTMYYRRDINHTSVSNVVMIVVPRIDYDVPLPRWPYTRSGRIAVSNNLIISSLQTVGVSTQNVQVEFSAGNQIKLGNGAHLRLESGASGSVVLRIGSPCAPTGGGGGGGEYIQSDSAFQDQKSLLSGHYIQAYPNPSSGQTTIRYKITNQSFVKLSIMDSRGRLISTIVDAENVEPGEYETSFDVKGLASGLYFYSLFTNSRRDNTKFVVED